MTQSTYLPLPGRISRKRRRHWRRQIIKNHPGINPAWLDARYVIDWVVSIPPPDKLQFPILHIRPENTPLQSGAD